MSLALQIPMRSRRAAVGGWRLLNVLAAGCAARGQREAPTARADAAAGHEKAVVRTVDHGPHFATAREPMLATFVLLDGRTGALTVHDTARARVGFRPASTFKIPNSLIALETGVVTGPEFALPFDSTIVPPDGFFAASWKRPHTLRTAFENSVLWYYQELARRVGAEPMSGWLERLDYGNASIGGGLDRFWVSGELRISPLEQVAFLRRLYTGGLPVSERATEIVKELMLLEAADAYRLYGKTGTSDVTPTRENGWLVGFVEVGAGVHFYALNLEGETVWEDWPPGKRAELVTALLRSLGVIV